MAVYKSVGLTLCSFAADDVSEQCTVNFNYDLM